MYRHLLIFSLSLLVAAWAANAGASNDDIVVEGGWTRSTAPGQMVSGGFMTIVNKGSEPDRLLAVTASWAGLIEIHSTTLDNGVMRMREMPDGVPVPAHSRVELKPRGLHLMLMQLVAPLEAGRTMPLTLQFERAGAVTAALRVVPAGQAPPTGAVTKDPK